MTTKHQAFDLIWQKCSLNIGFDKRHNTLQGVFFRSQVAFDNLIDTFSAFCFLLCQLRKWVNHGFGIWESKVVLQLVEYYTVIVWHKTNPPSTTLTKNAFSLVMWRIEFRTLCGLGNSPTPELHLQPFFVSLNNCLFFIFFWWGLHPGPCTSLGMCSTTEFHPQTFEYYYYYYLISR